MLDNLLPSFVDELEKLARLRIPQGTDDAARRLYQLHSNRRPKEKTAAPNFSARVDAHHDALEKDWGAFEKGLRAKGFRAAVALNPKSDEKLKKYTEAYGGYLASKDVVGIVPSRSSNKTYKVKRLADGRLACGCKDWQYKHSHQGTDCAHVQEIRPALKEKTSSLSAGMAGMRTYVRAKKQLEKGRAMERNVQRLQMGMPFEPVRK